MVLSEMSEVNQKIVWASGIVAKLVQISFWGESIVLEITCTQWIRLEVKKRFLTLQWVCDTV